MIKGIVDMVTDDRPSPRVLIVAADATTRGRVTRDVNQPAACVRAVQVGESLHGAAYDVIIIAFDLIDLDGKNVNDWIHNEVMPRLAKHGVILRGLRPA